MFLKNIAQNEPWRALYGKVNYAIQRELKQELHDSNFYLLADQVTTVLGDFFDKKERLFVKVTDELYTFNAKLSTIDDLRVRLKVADISAIPTELRSLWLQAHNPVYVRPYIHLVDNDSVKKRGVFPYGPVYGLKIFTRPINQFAKDWREVNHSFTIGTAEIALFIHIDLDQNLQYIPNDRRPVRLLYKEFNGRYHLADDTARQITANIKDKAYEHIINKRYEQLVKIAAAEINKGISGAI